MSFDNQRANRLDTDNEKKLKDIEKKIIRTGLLESPGSFMIALGLYAKFIGKGHAFYPALNNPDVIQFLLVVGTMILVWGSIRVFSLMLQKNRLLANRDH
jgi:hypothetical protein